MSNLFILIAASLFLTVKKGNNYLENWKWIWRGGLLMIAIEIKIFL